MVSLYILIYHNILKMSSLAWLTVTISDLAVGVLLIYIIHVQTNPQCIAYMLIQIWFIIKLLFFISISICHNTDIFTIKRNLICKSELLNYFLIQISR